jgi:hypothetical protein
MPVRLFGARCLDIDVAAYERFVEIWQHLCTHLNFPMYQSGTPVAETA